MIIDTHFHVWDLDVRRHAWLDGHPALRRRFDMADYRAASAPEGITASILVQVLASTAETEEFLALAATDPAIAGVIGWADLTRPDIGAEIARLRDLPGGDRLIGIRHLVHDEPDSAWLSRDDVRRGLAALGEAGLVFDLLLRPAQLPAAVHVTGQLGDVRFVLDHGAKPEIASGRLEPWARLAGELAQRPNVTCKLSGLVTEAGTGWQAEQIIPYAGRLLDWFGPGRLMFGSDWPVCTAVASYHDTFALARSLSGHLAAAERDAIFSGTAITTYALRIPGLGDGG
jgi:L-fuconolactonase